MIGTISNVVAFAGSTSLPTRTAKRFVLKCSIEPCPGCGREEGPVQGCDGEGRIIGGLGAVVNWWPIKAYRPCPNLVSARKKYARKGQSLNEIAFGRKSSSDAKSLQERLRGE